MALLEETFDKAAAVAGGCVWLAFCHSGAAMEPGVMAAVGAAGLIAVVTSGFRKHGLESRATLDAIRKSTRAKVESRLSTPAEQFAIRDVDKALAADLPDCFLDRAALVKAALDPAGFPTKAAKVVMKALAAKRPDMFGSKAPAAGRNYAREVITAALWAAVENRAYFESIQARLTFEQLQALARLLEGQERVEGKVDVVGSKVDAVQDDTRVIRDLVERMAATGLSEKQVQTLLTAFALEGVPLYLAEDQLLKSAEELRTLRDRLGRLTDDEPEIAAKLQAAKTAIDAADFPRADALLADAEALDMTAGQNRILRGARTIAERAALALAQAKFEEAADHYGRAATYAAPHDSEAASQYSFNQARALSEHGRFFPGLDKLRQAIVILCDQCLPHTSRESRPVVWAETQNSLGIALQTLGDRAGGQAGLDALNEAVDVYRTALEIYACQAMPAKWAGTQSNLGSALAILGDRAGGPAGLDALNQSVDAYRATLEVYTRQAMPVQWADTQNNLGDALQTLGAHAGGQRGLGALNQAVDACRAALEVRTRQAMPGDWAMTQNNLGNALANLGARAGGQAGLDALTQALDAYRGALQIRTREAMPVQWADTQNNLGNALQTLGPRAGGQGGLDALHQAVEAYRSALEVNTREAMPAQWAGIQNNLGRVLGILSEVEDEQAALEALNEAVDAYNAALKVRTRDAMPRDWAMTQNNLGNTLRAIGARADGQPGLDALDQAADAYRAALEIYTREAMPTQWAMTVSNLANAVAAISEITRDPVPLRHALQRMPNVIAEFEAMGAGVWMEIAVGNRDSMVALLAQLEQEG